ncbi:NADP-reducing hydrogenase subunit HndA [subsurface metagenome]
MVTVELDKVDEIIDGYVGEEGILIQLLLDIQSELNWIPKEALERISERLKIPVSQIYRIASFYKAMSLTPRGKHIINVCLGTACHVRGGQRIMDRAKELLGIKEGETTPDMKFTLERVNCLGCCALGPVVVVDGEYHGKVAPAKVEKTLKSYD